MIRKENLAVSRETFASERKGILADAEESLRPHIKEALTRVGLGSWEQQIVAAALDVFDVTARENTEGGSQSLDDLRDLFAKELGEALEKTGKASDQAKQLETMTRWVAMMSHNAAMEAATSSDPDGNVGLEWVAMSDGDVRDSHRDADGQQVPTGSPFTVGDVELMYPGQPVGDPSAWINCRCVARPTMLGELAAGTVAATVSRETLAAGIKAAYPEATNPELYSTDVSRETDTEETPMEDNSGPSTSSVIVALPEATDPLSAASSEKDGAHCTLLWFGDAAALDELALKEAIQQFIDHGQVTPVTDTVSGRATLGKDKADVVLMDAPNLLAIRSGLLEQNSLLQANESVEQHPTWLPHVTLGYPATPAAGEYASEPGTPVTFDRLALWHGESRTEFVLGASAPESPTVDDGAAALAALGTLVASAGVDVSRETEDEEPETDRDEEMQSLDGAEEFAEVPWYGVLTVEGVTTGDGRKFAEGSLTHRPLPMPLKFMWEDDEGHKGSYPIARIDRIFRDGNLIKAEGVFDTSEQAYEGVRLLANDIMRGVSVDLDSASLVQGGAEGDVMEFATGRISSATICSIPAFAEAFVAIGTWADAGGDVSRETSEEIEESTTAPTPPADAKRTAPTPKEAVASDVSRETFDIVPPKTMDGPGWVTDPKPTHKITSYWVDGRGAAKIGWGVPGDFNRCRAQLGKYVQNPAWLAGLCANLHYRALGAWPGKAGAVTTEMNVPIGPAASLVASAAPEVISADFFRNPELDGPTPVTRGENGHIFGHLAEWGTCHIAYEVCTTVPPSSTEYAYFLTGQVFTDVGSVAVGQLTVGGGHADPKLGVRAAMAHYDNVSSAVADVTVGEDAYGVWFSGRIRPWATERQIHELFAAGPSGDWRGVRSRGRDSMELVAAHAVNVQGFPVARTRFAIEGGRQVSLVAAGMPDRNKLAEANELLAEIRAAEFSMLTTTLTTLEGK